MVKRDHAGNVAHTTLSLETYPSYTHNINTKTHNQLH